MAIDPSGIEQYNNALKPEKFANMNMSTAVSQSTHVSKNPVLRKKKQKSDLVSTILNTVNRITDNDIVIFRNSNFDNAELELLTSGHRKSFEFLEEIVLTDREQHSGQLLDDMESLNLLKHYFVLAEDYNRDGRLNQVSIAYVEAAQHARFADLFWLQEKIIIKALEAAEKYKADGGKQLAYCQLLLAEMLESTKVRKLRGKNMIYGSDYMVAPPKKSLDLLKNCLEMAVGRSHWTSPENHIPFELIAAGHLARGLLATDNQTEENLKAVIKLSEQAGCIWLECLSNYYLAKCLIGQKKQSEASLRLERSLQVLANVDREGSLGLWSSANTCMQAPSLDRLAGMSTNLLCKIRLNEKNPNSLESCETLLKDYLKNWSEISLERANALNLLGEIYDRFLNRPEEAVEVYNEAYKIQPKNNSCRMNLGISNGHLMLDGIMSLYTSDAQSKGKTSKRLLIWKDQPEDWMHDMDSEGSD